MTADLGVRSSIPTRSHTFEEIYHEIISMFILFLLLIQEELLTVTSEIMCTKYWLTSLSQACPGKKVWSDCLDMIIAVETDVKHKTKLCKQQRLLRLLTCAGLAEPSLLVYARSTQILCTGLCAYQAARCIWVVFFGVKWRPLRKLGKLCGILLVNVSVYSKTCLKRLLKNRQNKDLNDKW